MCEYKFVKIELTAFTYSPKPKQDYHEVIEEHAQQGWRLNQIFAPSKRGYCEFIELIFERKV